MSERYVPAWWLRGGHSMTLWGKFFRQPLSLQTVTERWETPDDDFLEIIRLDPTANAPRLVILHGLEGSAHSHYVAGLMHEASMRGWGADVMIFRACGSALNRTRRTYHSGETTDIDFVVRRLAGEQPERPLVLCGISLGGNVLLKWLGEQRASVPSQIGAAAAISVPFDLARSCRHIDNGTSRIYSRHFLRSLRKKALAKIAQFPGIASVEAVVNSNSLWTFDDAFTSVVHGFRDAAEYYHRSSSIHFLPSIRVPTLLLSARDDPFHPPELLDDVLAIAVANPVLVPEFHARGGHVGFVAGTRPWRPAYYSERRVIDFLAANLARTESSTASITSL